MTAPAEKAAPIPAEDASGVDIQRLADRCAQSVYSSIGKRDITRPIKEAIVDAILADRASQEERIREDEREACAKIADDAARDAGASADRSEARTASGTSVLAGYIFARTEAEAIAKAIRLRARLRGDAS